MYYEHLLERKQVGVKEKKKIQQRLETNKKTSEKSISSSLPCYHEKAAEALCVGRIQTR